MARARSVQLGGRAEDGVEVVADPAGLSADEMERVFDVAWRGAPARTPTRWRGRSGARAGCRFTVLLPV